MARDCILLETRQRILSTTGPIQPLKKIPKKRKLLQSRAILYQIRKWNKNNSDKKPPPNQKPRNRTAQVKNKTSPPTSNAGEKQRPNIIGNGHPPKTSLVIFRLLDNLIETFVSGLNSALMQAYVKDNKEFRSETWDEMKKKNPFCGNQA